MIYCIEAWGNASTRQNHLLYINKSNINVYAKALESRVYVYGMPYSPKLM